LLRFFVVISARNQELIHDDNTQREQGTAHKEQVLRGEEAKPKEESK
jgi:hypothetical protein